VREQPRLNLDSGLHNAFPGLGEDGDELFYGPATDGIDYLRMVRSEAKAVPSLLVAQTKTIPDSGTQAQDSEDADEETEFYFDDGTYVAIRTGSQKNPSSGAQEHYYKSLIEDFLSLRAVLRRTPPLAAIQALGESRPITLPPDSKVARDAWERHIAHCDPHPVQLA
ncbi:MAG: hypothetical protein M1823_007646, partial [Watsoniomyces obsoletus]